MKVFTHGSCNLTLVKPTLYMYIHVLLQTGVCSEIDSEIYYTVLLLTGVCSEVNSEIYMYIRTCTTFRLVCAVKYTVRSIYKYMYCTSGLMCAVR